MNVPLVDLAAQHAEVGIGHFEQREPVTFRLGHHRFHPTERDHQLARCDRERGAPHCPERVARTVGVDRGRGREHEAHRQQ